MFSPFSRFMHRMYVAVQKTAKAIRWVRVYRQNMHSQVHDSTIRPTFFVLRSHRSYRRTARRIATALGGRDCGKSTRQQSRLAHFLGLKSLALFLPNKPPWKLSKGSPSIPESF